MIRFLLAALLVLAFPSAALAQEVEGSWALRIDDANIFVFVVERTDRGQWYGRWKRPASFRTNGAVFSQMVGTEETTSIAGREVAGEVELVFVDTRPGADPDTFRFRLMGPGQVQLTYVDTPLAPFPLVAVADGAALGPFDPARIYDRDNAATLPDAARPAVPAAAPATPPAPPAAAAPASTITAAPVAPPSAVGTAATPSAAPATTPAAAPAATVPAPRTVPAPPAAAPPAAAAPSPPVPPSLPSLAPRPPRAAPTAAAPASPPAATPAPAVAPAATPAAPPPAQAPAEPAPPARLGDDFLDDL